MNRFSLPLSLGNANDNKTNCEAIALMTYCLTILFEVNRIYQRFILLLLDPYTLPLGAGTMCSGAKYKKYKILQKS